MVEDGRTSILASEPVLLLLKRILPGQHFRTKCGTGFGRLVKMSPLHQSWTVAQATAVHKGYTPGYAEKTQYELTQTGIEQAGLACLASM